MDKHRRIVITGPGGGIHQAATPRVACSRARMRGVRPFVDPAVQKTWESPATLAAIGDYVARTLGRR